MAVLRFGPPNPFFKPMVRLWKKVIKEPGRCRYPDVKVQVFVSNRFHIETDGRYGGDNFSDLGKIDQHSVLESKGSQTLSLYRRVVFPALS